MVIFIKDSTIVYHEDSEPATVYEYEYTDSLIKDFMLDYSII